MNFVSWTTKYSPKAIKDFIGNINVIKDGLRYLKQYKSDRSSKAEFPKAILISGPNGTGKTEFAKQLALYRGYIPIEFSAALLRKAEEIQNCIDIYRSDVRAHFGPNHPLVIEALNNLDSTNMVKLGVGKALIIDELDATSKGYKGFVTALMELLKSTDGHNPNNVIIFTCDESTLASKLKTLSNQCYQLKFKQITDREMKKLVERVCEGENIKLQEHDIDTFAEYANGDCRRLLNGMELCFKNSIISDEFDSERMTAMIKEFVQSDETSIQRMKYSSLSSEKILHNLIHRTIQAEGIPLDLLPYIQSDVLTLCAQLYQTYPDLVRHDISGEQQIDAIADAMENISYADVFMDGDNGHDETFTFSDNHAIQGLVIPLSKLRPCIAKTFKMDVSGYAKLFGLYTSIEGQEAIKLKIQHSSPLFRNKTFEELRYVASAIAKMLNEEKYDELAKLYHDNDIDPDITDEFEKLRLLKSQSDEPHYFGIDLKDVWKNTHKRKFKKQFKEDTPVVQGVKFKDEKAVTKIDFFEKFDKGNKKPKV